MMKLVKLVLLFAVLVVGGALAVGFTQDPKMDSRTEVVVSAPLDKVWDVVSDPKRAPEWLPKDMADIESVEVLSTKLGRAAGAIVDAIAGKETPSGKSEPTHRYHLKDGTVLEMQTTASGGKTYMERVVGGDTHVEKFFESMEWGFELAPVDGDKGKTKITCVQRGVSKRPLGTFVKSVMGWIGKPGSNAKRMAANIEKVANAAK